LVLTSFPVRAEPTLAFLLSVEQVLLPPLTVPEVPGSLAMPAAVPLDCQQQRLAQLLGQVIGWHWALGAFRDSGFRIQDSGNTERADLKFEI